jgi:hypothetical protein
MILYSPPCPFVVITPDKYEFCIGDTVTIYADSFYTNYTYYQWFLNDVPLSMETNSVLIADYIVNDDLIYCRITGSTCDSMISNTIKFTIYQKRTPTITIDWIKYGTVIQVGKPPLCSGDIVIYSSVYTYGGNQPTFQWYRKLISGNWEPITGKISQVMAYVPVDGEKIACVMESNAYCVFPTDVTSNVLTMEVSDKLPVSVSISNVPSGTICPGTSVTYTATGINKGLSPTYKWYVNGELEYSGTLSTYTYVPSNGDLISVEMTSSLVCKTGSPAIDTISQNVEINVTPTITIISSPPYEYEDPGPPPLIRAYVSSGSTISFYAYGTNGCAPETYSWKRVRGANTITISTNNYFTYQPETNDKIYCIYTSSCQCVTINPVTSITVTIILFNPTLKNVTISSNPFPATICSGDTITFTVHPDNYTNPQYQWYLNDTIEIGTNSSTYSTNSIINGSIISCECSEFGGGDVHMSNHITVTVNQITVPTVTISRVPASFACAGELLTFYIVSSSNLGTSPTYQWWWNDGSMWRTLGGATDVFYQTTGWEDGNSIKLVVSNINTPCSTSTVTSNIQSPTITETTVPTIVIDSNPMCISDDLIFTSSVTNEGSNPTYQWFYSSNGSAYYEYEGVTTETWNTNGMFSSYTYLFVFCNMTSNKMCAFPTLASSNVISLTPCTGCTQNLQMVLNGDGWDTTDWINPSMDGLAEKWIKISRYSNFPYTLDFTNIITTSIGNNANGFTDNYQIAIFDFNTARTCCAISTNGYTFNVTEGQQDYLLRFKYRCGYWNGTSLSTTAGGIYPSLGVYIKQSDGAQILKVTKVPNITNALEVSVNFSHNNNFSSGTNIVSLWFGHSVGALNTVRIEIDEVNLWECPSGI